MFRNVKYISYWHTKADNKKQLSTTNVNCEMLYKQLHSTVNAVDVAI